MHNNRCWHFASHKTDINSTWTNLVSLPSLCLYSFAQTWWLSGGGIKSSTRTIKTIKCFGFWDFQAPYWIPPELWGSHFSHICWNSIPVLIRWWLRLDANILALRSRFQWPASLTVGRAEGFYIQHCVQTAETQLCSALLLPHIVPFICLTQKIREESRSYLHLKSGVDTDLAPDHRASSCAYQSLSPSAPGRAAPYLLSLYCRMESNTGSGPGLRAGYQEHHFLCLEHSVCANECRCCLIRKTFVFTCSF